MTNSGDSTNLRLDTVIKIKSECSAEEKKDDEDTPKKADAAAEAVATGKGDHAVKKASNSAPQSPDTPVTVPSDMSVKEAEKVALASLLDAPDDMPISPTLQETLSPAEGMIHNIFDDFGEEEEEEEAKTKDVAEESPKVEEKPVEPVTKDEEKKEQEEPLTETMEAKTTAESSNPWEASGEPEVATDEEISKGPSKSAEESEKPTGEAQVTSKISKSMDSEQPMGEPVVTTKSSVQTNEKATYEAPGVVQQPSCDKSTKSVAFVEETITSFKNEEGELKEKPAKGGVGSLFGCGCGNVFDDDKEQLDVPGKNSLVLEEGGESDPTEKATEATDETATERVKEEPTEATSNPSGTASVDVVDEKTEETPALEPITEKTTDASEEASGKVAPSEVATKQSSVEQKKQVEGHTRIAEETQEGKETKPEEGSEQPEEATEAAPQGTDTENNTEDHKDGAVVECAPSSADSLFEKEEALVKPRMNNVIVENERGEQLVEQRMSETALASSPVAGHLDKPAMSFEVQEGMSCTAVFSCGIIVPEKPKEPEMISPPSSPRVRMTLSNDLIMEARDEAEREVEANSATLKEGSVTDANTEVDKAEKEDKAPDQNVGESPSEVRPTESEQKETKQELLEGQQAEEEDIKADETNKQTALDQSSLSVSPGNSQAQPVEPNETAQTPQDSDGKSPDAEANVEEGDKAKELSPVPEAAPLPMPGSMQGVIVEDLDAAAKAQAEAYACGCTIL